MLKKWWQEPFPMSFLRQDAAGGGTALADGGEAATETAETEQPGEQVEETTEEQPEEETTEEPGTEETTETEGGEPVGGDLRKALHEERVEKAKLRERLDRLEKQVSSTSDTVRRLTPPEKDALETVIEKLPDGAKDSENAELAEQYAVKEDAKLIVRVLKHPEIRKALFQPILPLIQAMFRSLDLTEFQTEQAMEAFGAILKDEEFSKRFGDKMPLGIRQRDKLLADHKTALEGQKDGKYVPVRDIFGKLTEQYEAEKNGTAKQVEEATTKAVTRTLREVSQRRTATGSPRSEAAPERGGTGRRKMTPDQIDKSPGDFLV